MHKEVKETQHTENEDLTESVEMQSASVQEEMRNFKYELCYTEPKTGILHGQLLAKTQEKDNLPKLDSDMRHELTSPNKAEQRTNETVMHQRNRYLEQQLSVKEEQYTIADNVLRESKEQEETTERQSKNVEEELSELQQEENLRAQVTGIGQRLTVDKTDKQTIETELLEQLRERDQREAIIQRQLRKQQSTDKDERDEMLPADPRNTEEWLIDEMTEKESRETMLRKQLRESDQKIADVPRQLREMEQQLTEKEEREENLKTQLREMEQQWTEKEKREEILRTDLRNMEQRLKDEMTEKELRETELRKQLRGMDQKIGDVERQLREMERQLTEKEEREEILRTQLREMDQRLRMVSTETKSRETELHKRLTEKDQRVTNLQERLREVQQQLTEKEEREDNLQTQLRMREQWWREEMKRKETIETGLREQLRERNQQVSNFQRQLSEKELQWTEKEEQEVTLRMQLRQMEQRFRNEMSEKEARENGLREQIRAKDQREANLQRQLRETENHWRNSQRQFAEREVENANLRQQVDNLEDQVASQSHDWVISRNEIQTTDNRLGAGGWAEVFEGRYCGCSVAVKKIHEAIFSPYNHSLFQREIDIASRCRHPCLLQFIGATNDEEIPLLVTELMESSLRQLLEQRRLSLTEIIVISLDVARASNYLHKKKPFPIIHRDITSANVLLWRLGNRWRGKLSDYGTAQFMEPNMSIVPGCFAYSAPEVHRSSNQTVKVRIYINQPHQFVGNAQFSGRNLNCKLKINLLLLITDGNRNFF